jgi:hypothetical protein
MSNNYSIHLYIEGPDEDLQKVTKELDFSKQSYDDTQWEIEGGSAILHFNTHFCPYDEVKNASANYPSLHIKFRFSYELITVGLMIYENGRIKLDSSYNWETGESCFTKYN